MADYQARISLDNSRFLAGLQGLQAPLQNVQAALRGLEQALASLGGLQSQAGGAAASAATQVQSETAAIQQQTGAVERNTQAKRANATAAPAGSAVSGRSMLRGGVFSMATYMGVGAVSAGLQATGHEGAAEAVQGIGGRAAGGAAMGFAVGGPWGAAAGVAVGALAGSFGILTQRMRESQEKSEALRVSLGEIRLNYLAENRAIISIDNVREAEAAVKRISESILQMQQQRALGLVSEEDRPGFDAQLASQRRLLRTAEGQVGRAGAAEQAGNILRNREAAGEAGQASSQAEAEAGWSRRLAAADGTAETLALISERMAELQRQAAAARAALDETASPDKFKEQLAAVGEIEQKLRSLTMDEQRARQGAQKGALQERDAWLKGISSGGAARADDLAQMGIIGGGGGTGDRMAGNIERLVALTEENNQILADASRTEQPATWGT